jgi:hypothetical protein
LHADWARTPSDIGNNQRGIQQGLSRHDGGGGVETYASKVGGCGGPPPRGWRADWRRAISHICYTRGELNQGRHIMVVGGNHEADAMQREGNTATGTHMSERTERATGGGGSVGCQDLFCI